MAQGRITDKQKEILEFIKACILKKGYPPAVREICEAVYVKFVKRYSLSLPLLSTLIWNSLRRTDIFTGIRRNREPSRSLMTPLTCPAVNW